MTLQIYDKLAVREDLVDVVRKAIRRKRWTDAIYTSYPENRVILYRKNKRGEIIMFRRYKSLGWFYRYLTGRTLKTK